MAVVQIIDIFHLLTSQGGLVCPRTNGRTRPVIDIRGLGYNAQKRTFGGRRIDRRHRSLRTQTKSRAKRIQRLDQIMADSR